MLEHELQPHEHRRGLGPWRGLPTHNPALESKNAVFKGKDEMNYRGRNKGRGSHLHPRTAPIDPDQPTASCGCGLAIRSHDVRLELAEREAMPTLFRSTGKESLRKRER